MKAINKRTLIALLAVMTLIISSIGITVAYFSDVDEAQGAATLSLQGQTKIDEGNLDYKAIKVTNTGDADVLVRVKLFGVDTKLMDVNVPSNWAAGDDGWYYYKNILPGGQNPQANTGTEITVKVKEKLDPKVVAEMGESLNVTVVHEATPVVYDGDTLSVPNGWKLPSGVPAQAQ